MTVSNLLESDDSDSETRHVHDLEKVGALVRSMLPDNSTGVQINESIGIGKGIEGNVETQPYYPLSVVLGWDK